MLAREDVRHRGARGDRLADAAATGALLFFALVMSWELTGALQGGHLGNVAGSAIAGENMLRWRVFAAVLDYTSRPPTAAEHYTHHPYGVFVCQALFHAIFGHGWATPKLGAALASIASVALLHRFARALWGAVPAAVAAWVFVVTPIDLAFGQFTSLEVLTMAGGLLFSWATVRFFATWATRYLVASVVGALVAVQCDWVGLVLVGATGIFAFARAYALPPRWFGAVDDRQHARWFAWVTAVSVASLLLYLALFARSGHLADLLASYHGRSHGADAPWREIFGPRRVMWVLWMLPPPALAFVAGGALAHGARLVARADAREALPLAWLLAAAFQYLVFRQGADVHIFWPHYFGVVAALGAGALFACARAVTTGRTTLALAPFVVAIVALARVGLPMLSQSRLTGGRFDDGGRHLEIDRDRAEFARWAAERVPASGALAHRSFPPNWSVEYGLGKPLVDGGSLVPRASPDDPLRFSMIDLRGLSPLESLTLAREHELRIVGPFALVDRSARPAPPRALSLVERQPGPLERWLVTGTDLVRTIGPHEDPFATWEWREHLGHPADPPSLAPRTADESRVAFNVGASRGLDEASLAPLLAQARTLAAGPPRVAFDGDLDLLGCGVERGAATVVTLLWRTGPAFVANDADFLVRSRVIAPPPLWPSAIDFFEKEAAPPVALRPGLWRPGRLYLQRFVAMPRVGVERFEGVWVARGSAPRRPLDGRERVELFTLR